MLPKRTVDVGGCPLIYRSGVCIIGGGDGTVTCAKPEGKRWTTQAPLWVDKQSHGGTRIVAVALHPSLHAALTSDEVGNIFLHEHVGDPDRCVHKRLCRNPGACRAMAFNTAGDKVVLAGDVCRILDLSADPPRVSMIKPPVAPPLLAVAWSPCETMLAVASAGRAVAVVPLKEDAAKTLAPNVLDAAVRTADMVDVKVCWTPDGRAVFPASEGVRVFTARGDGGFSSMTISTSTSLNGVRLFPRSKHQGVLLVNTAAGLLVPHRLDTRSLKLLDKVQPNALCGGVLYWDVDPSTGNGLACDDRGCVSFLHRLVRGDAPAPLRTATQPEASQAAVAADAEDGSTFSEDEDLEAVVHDLIRDGPGGTAKKDRRAPEGQPAKGGNARSSALEGLLDDEAEESDDVDEFDSEEDAGMESLDEEEEEEDSHNGLDATRRFANEQAARSNDLDDFDTDAAGVAATLNGGGGLRVRRHPVVHLGRTKPDSSGQRYLAYTTVGAIRETPEGIAVLFHDKARPVVRIPHHRGRCIGASLGPHSAALLFSNSEDDDEDASDGVRGGHTELVVKSFVSAQVGARDFTVALPGYDAIRCVAQGKRFTCVFTANYMRVFGMGGIEVTVSCVSHVVCASGLNTTRCPLYADTADPILLVREPVPGSLTIATLNLDTHDVLEAERELPLTPAGVHLGATLEWVGWSDDGFILAQDSVGVVRMLTNEWGGSWMPVADSRATGEADRLWLWGATEDKLWAVRCPWGEDPPVLSELPPPAFINFHVPAVGRGGAERGPLVRQLHMRLAAKLNHAKRTAQFYTDAIGKADAKTDSLMLKAFDIELKTTADASRCLDMALQFQLVDTVEKALRMAHEANQSFLSEKLIEVAKERVKKKRRRLSTLPLEGSTLTEKDRDKMLRRLLAKEKASIAQVQTPSQQQPQEPPLDGEEAHARDQQPALPCPEELAPANKPLVPAAVKQEPAPKPSPPRPRPVLVQVVEPPPPVVKQEPAAGMKAFNPFAAKKTTLPAPPGQHEAPATPQPKRTSIRPVGEHTVAPLSAHGPSRETTAPAPLATALTPRKRERSVPAAVAKQATPPRSSMFFSAAAPDHSRPPNDPFLTSSQITDAMTEQAWNHMESSPARPSAGLPAALGKSPERDTPSRPSSAVADALTKRFRDEDADDEFASAEALHGFDLGMRHRPEAASP